ncbi:rod shape-determining protein MreC, partial [Treponema pallidum]
MEKAFFFRIDSDLFTFIVFLLVSSGLLVFSGGELIVSFRDVGFSVTSRVEKAAASVSFFVTHTVKTLK